MRISKIDKAGRKALQYRGVTGYTKKLVRRMRNGKEVDEWVLQVHVPQKLPECALKAEEILPKEIDGIPVDVVKRGPFKALASVVNPNTILKHRPLIAGTSIGNRQITAGTLGWFFQNQSYDDGLYLGSNAHVFTPDPIRDCFDPAIVQPGMADQGNEIVAKYTWHELLHAEGSTGCSVANSFAGFGNAIAKLFHRKSRIKAYLPEQAMNHIDFAVAKPIVEYDTRIIESRYTYSMYEFVGLAFAGGPESSLVCKQNPYITATGWTPYKYDIAMFVTEGEKLYKTGRTTFKTECVVDSNSVTEIVDYGGYKVLFDDVILTSKFLEGGDSGSAVFRKPL